MGQCYHIILFLLSYNSALNLDNSVILYIINRIPLIEIGVFNKYSTAKLLYLTKRVVRKHVGFDEINIHPVL